MGFAPLTPFSSPRTGSLRVATHAGALLALWVASSACGDDDGTTRPDAGPSIPRLTAEPLPAYEGQRRYVGVITGSVELAGASVVVADPSVRVLEQRCAATACAVVLEVDDTTMNEGLVVPRPIRSRTVPIQAQRDGQTVGELALPVFFLDALRLEGEDEISGSFVASSLEMPPGNRRPGRPGVEPFRVFVLGATTLRGELAFGADEMAPRGGGTGGGADGRDGEGTGAGRAATGAGGGGGGGHATAGADGTGDGAGRGGAVRRDLDCLSSITATGCGGAGGAGAMPGVGGAGGGALFVASLAPIDAAGLVVDVHGAPGVDGGGGGAGGFAWLAAPAITGGPTVRGAGGTGGSSGGGEGGRGWARFDGALDVAATLDGAEPMTGPSIAMDTPSIVMSGSIDLRGRGEPGREVVLSLPAASISAPVADDGTWTATLSLAPGLNRIRVEQRVEGQIERGWSGTSYEFDSTGHPIGAFHDIVSLGTGSP
ncbi:MAG: hypothetical protein IT379_25270 [Deltaproteobacteria bacterium]|nr:hypothetical protein [Deltaproteobacteria bacterium]